MTMLMKMGWRNIWRNKRRSLLTILAIVFATFFTIVQQGIAIGTWEYGIANAVEMFAGYLQIQKHGYQDNPSLAKSFPYPGRVTSILDKTEAVTGYAPRIQADGLASYRENSAGAAIIGIDPASERRISRFHERVKSGRMLGQNSTDEVVVGYKLLANLKAQVGDTVVILAQGFDGVMGNQKYRIVGAMKFGSPEFDAVTIAMHIRAAQELLAMEGRVNIVAIGTRGLHAADDVRREVVVSLAKQNEAQLDVLPWNEVMPELKQSMDFDQVNHLLILAILIVIVAFGVLNTVLMSVTERFREFGIALAIGMQPAGLVRLLFIETICLALVGIAVGGSIGMAVNAYVAYHPIPIGGDLAQLYEDYGFMPVIVATTRISIPLTFACAMLLVSLLSCLYPAFRVSRLEPLKGIRHT